MQDAALPICPPTSAPSGAVIPAHYKLPVLARFCRRGRLACAAADDVIQQYFQGSYRNGAHPVLQLEADQGLGFGAALQAKTQHLLLGLATGRPAHIWMRARVFNRGGSLLAPPASASPYIDDLPQSVGYASRAACEQGLAVAINGGVLLPSVHYDCVSYPRNSSGIGNGGHDGGGSDGGENMVWLPLLDQAWVRGRSWALRQGSWWDARHSAVLRPVDIGSLFPNRTALAIDKKAALRFMIGRLVLARVEASKGSGKGAGKGAAAAAGPPAWSPLALEQLARSTHHLAGPGCLVRHLITRAAPPVLQAVANVLAEPAVAEPVAAAERVAAAEGGRRLQPLVVGVHIRRGDRAMHGECTSCVNPNEQDIHGSDRIGLDAVRQRLGRLNRTLVRLGAAICRPVTVFLASDTALGARLARRALTGSGARVIHTQGLAVVSSNTHVTRRSTKYQRDSVKVAADFLALAVSDVVVSVGDSAFSSNAAAMGFGLALMGNQRPEQLIELPRANDLARLRASFEDAPSAAQCAAAAR